MTDDSPTAEEIAAAAPPLTAEARERLRRALAPTAPLPPQRSRADVRRSAAASARTAVAGLREHDAHPAHRSPR